jgi:hypothetical protein
MRHLLTLLTFLCVYILILNIQAIMKFIFPSAINGNLLKLVHLSNGFRMVEGAGPLQVGEVCRAEARIASVTNTKAGKIVKVKGHVYREDKPVIEVVSSFFYRGRFTNFGISCHYKRCHSSRQNGRNPVQDTSWCRYHS